jgi:hypothetical protein
MEILPLYLIRTELRIAELFQFYFFRAEVRTAESEPTSEQLSIGSLGRPQTDTTADDHFSTGTEKDSFPGK